MSERAKDNWMISIVAIKEIQQQVARTQALATDFLEWAVKTYQTERGQQ